jgi:hypothetical protein
MTISSSIYDNPFSDETKKIRRNSLLASGLSLFIGLSGSLPEKFSLLGISFSMAQQNTVGWFIFSISTYLFLLFILVSVFEIAKWYHPFHVTSLAKKTALEHPDFCEDDFEHIPAGPAVFSDEIYHEAKNFATSKSMIKLSPLFRVGYVKVAVETLVPLIIGAWGLYKLFQLLSTS